MKNNLNIRKDLKTEAVAPSTLELLRSLQKNEYMAGFNPVGGTALSFYWGRRLSDWPGLLHDKKLTWPHVKQYIKTKVLNYVRK